MLRELHSFVVRKLGCGLPGRQDLLDDAIAHRDSVVREDRAGRFDRYDPASAEEEAAGRYLGVPWTSTTTRRLSARHAISPLRSFWSGQALTGSVLPKPRVSTFPASTPLETR